jgi:hypothetical protein
VGAIIKEYGPRCRLSSVKSGKLEMKLSIGMTNAAVLPEPVPFCQGGQQKLTARYPTSLCDADNIAILQTDWYGLSLNRRWFLVADLIDNFEELWRDRRLAPGP